jgi:hypothetical protein
VKVIRELNAQIGALEERLAERFHPHPDAKTIRSPPGLAMVLGARVLGEFGYDPNRYAESRKDYVGTSPTTKASGTRRVVLAPGAHNRAWPTPATSGLRRREGPSGCPDGPTTSNWSLLNPAPH